MLLDRSNEFPRFRATSAHDSGVYVIAVNGEIEMANAATLENHLAAAHHSVGPVLVDLTGLTFIDSTGLHVLCRAHGAITGQGRRFALVRTHAGQPQRLLELTVGDQLFESYGDRVTAIDALRGYGLPGS